MSPRLARTALSLSLSLGLVALLALLAARPVATDGSHDFRTGITSADIGLLVDLHVPGAGAGASPKRYPNPVEGSAERKACGALNVAAVQPVLAAKWATSVVNNPGSGSLPIQMGVKVFDTCGDADVAMKDVFYAVKDALDTQEERPLLGLIGLGEAEVVGETVTMLHAFDMAMVLASPRLAEMVVPSGNILTTASDMGSVVRPVVEVGQALGAPRMSLVASCVHSERKFMQALAALSVKPGRLLQVNKHSAALVDVVKKFLDDAEDGEVVALILEPEEVSRLAEGLRSYSVAPRHIQLITGTIGLNRNLLRLGRGLFAGSYLIEPHMPELPDFRNYLIATFAHMQHGGNDSLVKEYMAAVYNCDWHAKSDKKKEKRRCASLSLAELSQGLQINPEVTFVVKAVSSFSAALFLLQVERCERNGMPLDKPCNTLMPSPTLKAAAAATAATGSKPGDSIQQDILAQLAHLSFSSHHNAPYELPGTRGHLTHNGQLVANKYLVAVVRDDGQVTSVGWYSDDQGLRVDVPVRKVKNASPEKKQGRDFRPVSSISFPNPALELRGPDSIAVAGDGVNARKVAHDTYLGRLWGTALVAVAAVGVMVTIMMLVYVLVKICDGTLAGNQSLGVLLLLGIMALLSSVVPFVLPVTVARCGFRMAAYPVALALCYGILLVKVMQLRSLVLLGLGGRISYLNQYLILFFIVLVQVVINIQWYLHYGPQLRFDSEGAAFCYLPRADFLLLHAYVAILAVLAFGYGLSVLKIRRNYKEGRWVTLAAGLSLPVLACWGVAFAFGSDRYDELTTCISLLLLAMILILAIFIPKMSTIAKQQKHFQHKKMHIGADSVNTIFTSISDLQRASPRQPPAPPAPLGRRGGGSGGVGGGGGLSHAMPQHPSRSPRGPRAPHMLQHNKHLAVPYMADAYSDYVTKNPIYEVTNGAYP